MKTQTAINHETPPDAKHVLADDAVKLKLTPKQNMIVFCLQNGWQLITQSCTSTVTCCSAKGEFTFNSSILFRLVRMGLIHQSNWQRANFDYVLTVQGKKFKTKNVPLDEWM
jgi:hypothetical protein